MEFLKFSCMGALTCTRERAHIHTHIHKQMHTYAHTNTDRHGS